MLACLCLLELLCVLARQSLLCFWDVLVCLLALLPVCLHVWSALGWSGLAWIGLDCVIVFFGSVGLVVCLIGCWFARKSLEAAGGPPKSTSLALKP